MAVLFVSGVTYLAAGLLLAALALRLLRRRGAGGAPGPAPWPVVGNLHLLRGYAVPYQGFVELSKKFGDVYSLRLGSVPAVVVQGVDNIREVLVQKSHHFDSRPNFNRYHQLFHGDKENSLAFCDWSNVQKKRRDLLKDHVFPKVYTNNYQHLNRVICEEINKMIEDIKDAANNNSKDETKKEREGISTATEPETCPEPRRPVHAKDRVLPACATIFLRYFCSAKPDDDEAFRDFVRSFDEIFYEVNQGYAYDFLPFLAIFYRNEAKKMRKHSEGIRKFVLEKVVSGRTEDVEENSAERDYVDALLKTVKFGNDVEFNMETALFSLEDIIGGHSAVGNFLVKLLAFLADDAPVQEKIKQEVDARGKPFVTLDDRPHMPYTEAVVMETLRVLSSPIVPHVSNRDTSISGYPVEKDTLVFLNNYELNTSEVLWSDPGKFEPGRFVDPATGTKRKPAHFLPFGGGKRSCMGYKLVQFVSFVFLANVVGNFEIRPVPGEKYEEVGIGNLALPTRTYKFDFRTR